MARSVVELSPGARIADYISLGAIATRYDKTARNFLAAVHFAATLIWLI